MSEEHWVDGELMWPGPLTTVDFKVGETQDVRRGRCLGLKQGGVAGDVELLFEACGEKCAGRWWRAV